MHSMYYVCTVMILGGGGGVPVLQYYDHVKRNLGGCIYSKLE